MSDTIREQIVTIKLNRITKLRLMETTYIASISDLDVVLTSSSSSSKTALTSLIDKVFSEYDNLTKINDESLSTQGQTYKTALKRFCDFFSK